jgi:DNA-binding transcriptional regulator LsrR (DeoR family)
VGRLEEQLLDKKLLSRVCRMYYIDNLTQQAIGERLGISRMRIARLLEKARTQGFVEITLKFGSMELAELEGEIEATFGIRECAVVPTYDKTEQMLNEMAGALSGMLDRHIADAMIIGVSWGTTLEAMSRYVQVKRKRDVTIIPIVGAVGVEGSGSYTNYVTRGFAERIGGINYTINVPAVVNSRVEKDVMENVDSTRQIIELAEKARIILVGLSDASIGSSLGKTGNFRQEETDYLRTLGIIGNVNLVFLNAAGEHVENRVEERIVRILEPSHMKRVPITIGIAFGKSKVQVITSALRGGWINHLVTDEETATQVLRKEKRA